MSFAVTTLVRVKAGATYPFPTFRWIANLNPQFDLIAVRDDDLPASALPHMPTIKLPKYGTVIVGMPPAARAITNPHFLARYGQTFGDDVG